MARIGDRIRGKLVLVSGTDSGAAPAVCFGIDELRLNEDALTVVDLVVRHAAQQLLQAYISGEDLWMSNALLI